jgi:predicted Zn-dependent protease
MNLRGLRAAAQKPAAMADRKKICRRLLLAGLAVTLTLTATVGRSAFSRWQHGRLIGNAAKALANGDLRSASLNARQAFLKNPASTSACAILAQIAEHEQSPEAILWRQRLVEINPHQSPRLIELAITASALGETFIAEQALAQVPVHDRDTVAFHSTAAAVAIAEKQLAVAEKEFQRAAELDPKDENLRLNLATLRLALAQPGAATEAAAKLERFLQRAEFRHAALRALLTDARRRGDSERAMNLAKELRQGADPSLGDVLLWLEELQHAHSPEFDGELHSLQALAAKSDGAIYAVMAWMNARGLAAQSAQWADSLPALVRSRIPVPLALAEAFALTGDWKKIRGFVADSDWGDMDFLRIAFHARVLYETSDHVRRAEFRTMWERATNATKGNTNALSMLARLVTGWGWKDEAAQLWWIIARNSTGQRPALKMLYAMYAGDKNTRELYRVARRVLEVEPGNPVARNNVATLALTLGEDEPEAHRLAAENYRLTPTQPVIASTYAFSLHKQKRTAEAVAILKRLPPAALADPSIAACYGLLLAENGEATAARPFLKAAERQKAQLFPEEAAMVADALRDLP